MCVCTPHRIGHKQKKKEGRERQSFIGTHFFFIPLHSRLIRRGADVVWKNAWITRKRISKEEGKTGFFSYITFFFNISRRWGPIEVCQIGFDVYRPKGEEEEEEVFGCRIQ